ncbi:MAG: helix-turn-helix domain-containing protein [Parachlamydiales bacterium]
MEKRHKPHNNWRNSFRDLLQETTEAGATLKGLRTREGWTQADLASRLGVNQSNVSKMERGVRPIGKEMAKRLATLFKTDYRLFL